MRQVNHSVDGVYRACRMRHHRYMFHAQISKHGWNSLQPCRYSFVNRNGSRATKPGSVDETHTLVPPSIPDKLQKAKERIARTRAYSPINNAHSNTRFLRQMFESIYHVSCSSHGMTKQNHRPLCFCIIATEIRRCRKCHA